MSAMSTKEFLALLGARSAELVERESLRRKFAGRRNLRVKLGIDPTTPDLHLGHIVPLRLLRDFQDAGHHAVLIIGDFTSQIGDPSGKAAARRQLSTAEARANERTYRAQISRVLDMRRAEVRHNSEWYGRMRLGEFLATLARFSLKSASERADFKKRIAAGKEVRLHEAVYHVLQAYDSVMVRADIEIGSLDQKLNILAGRELQKKLGIRAPQDAVLVPYLIGLDGREKMSKSAGNTINLRDSADEMFGKAMSIPDTLIMNYAELAAWLEPAAATALTARLAQGVNPRDVKLDVAEAIVSLYHGQARGRRARGKFLELFSRREAPAALPRVRLARRAYPPVVLLEQLQIGSKSEARRLLRDGAVEVDGRPVSPRERTISLRRGSVIRVGKKKFFRVS